MVINSNPVTRPLRSLLIREQCAATITTWFYGQDVAPQQIPKMCITDILPSVLEWMQIPFGNMDGKAVPGLWK